MVGEDLDFPHPYAYVTLFLFYQTRQNTIFWIQVMILASSKYTEKKIIEKKNEYITTELIKLCTQYTVYRKFSWYLCCC